jgi:parallel beta-helix repeat protein
VENLSVDGGNSGLTDCNTGIVGIYYQNASGIVRSVSVQNQVGFTNCGRGLGVYVETDGTATSNVTVQNSSIRYTSGLNIGATYAGTTVMLKNNTVVGSSVSLDNGIYLAGGATGTVSGNSVINFAAAPDTLGDDADASCGIAVSGGSQNVTVSSNSIGNTEVGICVYANSNNNTLTSNKIFSTQFNDGIYLCSNGNLVQHNVISTSADAAVRLDNGATKACTGLANSNTITFNTINGACVGILEPSGTTGNVISPNTLTNVGAVTSTSICP